MSKPTFSSIINLRGFRFLWINQILMQLAINTLNFALILWVYKLTNSNLAVSALILSVYLPALLFGVFAGVFVDRVDRRRIIILVDLLFAIAFFIFSIIKQSYPLILLDTFFINSLTQFFTPAEASSIPQLVPKKLLFLANSLFTLTLYSAFMIGFTIAGPVLNLWGINSVFYFGTAALFSGFLLSQGLPSMKSKTKIGPFEKDIVGLTLTETRQTFKFIAGKLNIAVSIGLLAGIQGVIGILAVTVSSYMERVLRIRATDASFVLMLPLGLGMISGALIIGRLFQNVPRRLIVIPAIITSGILFFAVGVAPTIARYLNAEDLPIRIHHLRFFLNAPSLSSTFAIGAFLLGICAVAIIIPSQTTIQESTPEQIRGKIFATLAVLMNAFAFIPVILAGALSDLFGVTPIFIGLGVIIFVIGILALRPALMFEEKHLPFKIREFLGLGHWEREGE